MPKRDERSHHNDPDYLRSRAEEAETIADGMSDPDARETMQSVAQSYRLLAESAENRLRAAKRKPTE
jgi:hypothetical protein